MVNTIMLLSKLSPLAFLFLATLTFVRTGRADVFSTTIDIEASYNYKIVETAPLPDAASSDSNAASLQSTPLLDLADIDQSVDIRQYRIYPCRAYCSFYGSTLHSSVVSYLDLRIPYAKRLDIASGNWANFNPKFKGLSNNCGTELFARKTSIVIMLILSLTLLYAAVSALFVKIMTVITEW